MAPAKCSSKYEYEHRILWEAQSHRFDRNQIRSTYHFVSNEEIYLGLPKVNEFNTLDIVELMDDDGRRGR